MALWEKSKVKPFTLRKEVMPVPMSTPEFMTFRDRSGLGGQKIPGVHGVGKQKP